MHQADIEKYEVDAASLTRKLTKHDEDFPTGESDFNESPGFQLGAVDDIKVPYSAQIPTPQLSLAFPPNATWGSSCEFEYDSLGSLILLRALGAHVSSHYSDFHLPTATALHPSLPTAALRSTPEASALHTALPAAAMRYASEASASHSALPVSALHPSPPASAMRSIPPSYTQAVPADALRATQR